MFFWAIALGNYLLEGALCSLVAVAPYPRAFSPVFPNGFVFP